MIYKTLDEQYISVLKSLVEQAESSDALQDRTGVGIYKSFGNMIQIDLSDGFPMLLSRQVPFKSIVAEFLFFLNGFTNNKWLEERNCKYWDGFKHPQTGELGPVYGAQLRNFNNEGYDQLYYLIDGLLNRPNSRRHMFTYFNPLVMPDETKSHKENIENGKAVLPPCHLFYQFNVRDGYLDGLLFQRSSDWCIGAPSNIAQTGLWIYLLSKLTSYKPGTLTYMTGDTHLYKNHISGAKEFIRNFDSIEKFDYPSLELNKSCHTPADNTGNVISFIESLSHEDFKLLDYYPKGKIKFEIAI